MGGVTDTVYLDFKKVFKFLVKVFPSHKVDMGDEGKDRKQCSTMCSVLTMEGPRLFSKELEKQEANVVLKFADDTKLR